MVRAARANGPARDSGMERKRIPGIDAYGRRVRVTPREREAVGAYWSEQRVARGTLIAVSSLMAVMGVLFLAAGLFGPFLGHRREHAGWVLLMLGATLLPAGMLFLWLLRRRARLVSEDLALGVKIVVHGIVDACSALRGKAGAMNYSIRIAVPPGKGREHFAVTERVFMRVGRGDAVRCAYLPASRILLSLKADAVAYAIGESA